LSDHISPLVQRRVADGERGEEDEELAQAKAAGQVGADLPGLQPHLDGVRAHGSAMPPHTTEYFGSRFGYDFSKVRIHTDDEAADLAHRVKAQAFTVGRDIFFGAGRYAPSTPSGRRLLAHELTHVVQQANGVRLQRQTLPQSPPQSVDLRLLSDQELRERYDRLTQQFASVSQNGSAAEIQRLRQEAEDIGAEVSRREGLASGRTFTDTDIQQMRAFFVANVASGHPLNCIDTLNRGMRTVLHRPQQRVGSSIQNTMARLAQSGLIAEKRVIEFLDQRGRITYGVIAPVRLSRSVWDTVIDMSGHDVGWSVFGMSMLDGHHSVTLVLDYNNPSHPIIYRGDWWTSMGGWIQYTKASLDSFVERNTIDWWTNDLTAGGQHRKSRLTLWRVRARPSLGGRP